MERDESTYGGVRKRYDEYVDRQQSRPVPERTLPAQKPYTPNHEDADMGRYLFASIGAGIAVVLLALAGWAFYTAAQWGSYARDGAQVGYLVVGIFLTIASIGGLAAIYNHNFRVLTQPPEHH